MNRYEKKKNMLIKMLKEYTTIGASIETDHEGHLTVWQNGKWETIQIKGNGESINEYSELMAILDEMSKDDLLSKKVSTISDAYRNGRTTNTENVSYETAYGLYSDINDGKYVFFAREFGNEKSLEMYSSLKKKIRDIYGFETIMLEEDIQIGNIHNYMYDKIKNCRLMIADLTAIKNDNKWNANVIYEMGMAIGSDKKVLQILSKNTNKENKDKIAELPFDISSHTTFSYNENKIEQDSDEIIKLLASYLNET